MKNIINLITAIATAAAVSSAIAASPTDLQKYLKTHPEQIDFAVYLPGGSEDDMKLSFSMYLKALSGDKQAQEYFGDMILHRFGTRLDVENADFWLRMSTTCGSDK
jgi:TPR repeat protein